MSFILTDEMLLLASRVLKGLEVSPKDMERNLELSQGAVLAERIVNMLVEKGVARQDAYDKVRKVSVRSSTQVSLSAKRFKRQLRFQETNAQEIKELLTTATISESLHNSSTWLSMSKGLRGGHISLKSKS